jgi:hypothetical protein
MSFNDFLQSKKYSRIMASLGILLAALVIFAAGAFVGYRKADFSYRWSDNYYRDFGGPGSPFNMSHADDNAPTSHGAFGKIVAVNLPSFAVQGPDEAEKVVIIDSQTIIRSFHNQATTTDIQPGQFVVVIGEPDDNGQIQASLVRIVPSPSPTSSAPMTY